jgi:hypothetical protein
MKVLSNSSGKGISVDFFIDFESAAPSPAEQAIFDKVNAVLARSASVLSELEGYGGAGDFIRHVFILFNACGLS